MSALFRLKIICAVGVLAAVPLKAQSFKLQAVPADLARWIYPFNASPASRPTASAFAAFGSAPDFDTRDGQYLLGWNTSNSITSGLGARNYLLRRVRVTLTISRDMAYAYSGTLRDFRTYFPTNDPRYIAPTSSNSPVELFGAGFRGGYTAMTFQQDSPFFADPSAGDYTNRTAYAACFDTNGVLVDVSNNVGDDGTNEIAGPFEVAPFAVGQAINVTPGQLMPEGSQLTFDVNLDDPLIYGYFQQALNGGAIRLVASSLVNANFFSGSPNYPDFYTIFSPLADPDQFPLLDLEGSVVRTNLDADSDGLPDDWEQFYFSALGAGATEDSDGDGESNLAEYQTGTSPTSATNVLRVLALRRGSGADELEFSFAPSRRYQLQWSDDLQHWQTESNPVISYVSAWLLKTGASPIYPSPVFARWRDTNGACVQRFYRVTTQ